MIRSPLGAYEEWFKYHSDNVTVALQYLVSSLDDEYLAPEAAIALKSVCDLCRGTLSNHVAAFGQLHGKVAGMGVSTVTLFVSHLTYSEVITPASGTSQSHRSYCKRLAGDPTIRGDPTCTSESTCAFGGNV
jgi:hypothetical protein